MESFLAFSKMNTRSRQVTVLAESRPEEKREIMCSRRGKIERIHPISTSLPKRSRTEVSRKLQLSSQNAADLTEEENPGLSYDLTGSDRRQTMVTNDRGLVLAMTGGVNLRGICRLQRAARGAVPRSKVPLPRLTWLPHLTTFSTLFWQR